MATFRASDIYGRKDALKVAAPASTPGINWDDPAARDRFRSQMAQSGGSQMAQGGSWGASGPSWQAGAGGAGGGGSSWRPQQPEAPVTGLQHFMAAGAQGRTNIPWSGYGSSGPSWRPQQAQTSWASQRFGAQKQAVPHARTTPAAVPAFVPDASSQSATTTSNTITIQGQGVGLCGDDGVDEACRLIAIGGGFSVHDHVRVPSASLAHVEFPHRDAAAQFMEATRGSITIKGKVFTVKHPQGGLAFAPPSGRLTTAHSAETVLGTGAPTDTLMVRQIGSAGDAELHEAFVKIAPRVRSVRVVKDCRGVSRGHAFVYFHEVYEATNALRHFRSSGSMVNGRRCTADFASPQTFEEGLEQQVQKKEASKQIGDSHAQALSGPNADMWATYLSMFDEAASQEAAEDSLAEAKRRILADQFDPDPEPDAKRPRTEESSQLSIENHLGPGMGMTAPSHGDLQQPPAASAPPDMRPPPGGPLNLSAVPPPGILQTAPGFRPPGPVGFAGLFGGGAKATGGVPHATDAVSAGTLQFPGVRPSLGSMPS